ncbi:MAG: hypothetical protein KJ646_02550 [Nanoarchaeota archaeon]|nr:hypothetical protein [Nanoarchaeota archaeon]MBU4116307.1 hypothetical protein [Nanoarchaeota archaeon]
MGMRKKRINAVYLDTNQFKLFKFLKVNSADFSNWSSLKDISKKLKISENATKKLISSLREKEGIALDSKTEKKGEMKIRKYGLAPETLGILVKSERDIHKNNKNGNLFSALYLAEPCFGTKAFEERYTMKGLALALEVNGLAGKIQEVIIQGGVIPHLPPYSSKSYDWDLKFLGQIDKEKTRFSEKLLEDKIETSWEREFYEKFIHNSKKSKITTLTDAFKAAENQLSPLMNSLPEDTVLRIQLGEEDRKNIEHLQAARVQEWAKEKGEKINKIRDEIMNESYKTFQDSYIFLVQKSYLEKTLKNEKILRKINEKRIDFKKRILNNFQDFLMEVKEDSEIETSNFWEDHQKILGLDINEILYGETIKEDKHQMENFGIERAMNYVSRSQRKSKNIKQGMKKLENLLQKTKEKQEDLSSRLEDLNESASWTKQLLESGRKTITWFTRQYPVFSDEVELIFKQVKDKYTQHFFNWNISQPTVIHVSPRKRIEIETGVITNVLSNEKDKLEVDYSVESYEKKRMLLIHNINHITSDGIAPNAIKKAKELMNHENIVLKKLYEEELIKFQPDILLLGGHQTGGFRVMPWFKDSEQIIQGEFVENQKISYLIHLPTLQSIPRLEWLISKGFKNWHTKRYQSGPYASAAIIHTEDKEGVGRFGIINSAQLEKFGKKAEEIEVYRKELKKNLSSENRKEIFKLIKEKKEEVKINFKKIEAAGDFHLGAPDYPGRYSKDQFIEAMQYYQIKKGLPEIISWDEIPHGCLDSFGSGSRYLGMTPAKFKRKIINPILESDLNPEEKAREIARESLRNHRAITIHNQADQKELFAEMLRPYAEKVIKNGGKLILTSGNHANNSDKKSDEALELANQFSTEYRDKNKVIAFSGKGNPVGVGAIRLDGGQTLFVMHKFPERQDEIYGIMTHLRKMNNDADIVIAGDRHQTGAGYADGHLIVLHPGMEPINTYVPLIGKPAGVRGFNNIYFDPNKRGIYAVEFILNNTLEKIVKEENII